MQQYSALPHVLIVDDDKRIRDLVTRFLEDNGFMVMAAQDAAQARALLDHFEFDVLVLDVMMPGESGVELTRYIHEHSAVPVLLLTALGEAHDRISGLEAGADDYLPKPFEPRELVLRLRAILKRSGFDQKHSRRYSIGPWTYDTDHAELYNGRETVKLTASENALLGALASQAGHVISREKLAALSDMGAGERTIDVQVTRVRRKIEEDTKAPRYLQTVRGKGYLLRSEPI